MSYLTNGRRRLGRPSKELLENMKRLEQERDEMRKKLLQKKIMCGIYEKGTELKVRIVYFQNVNDFCIRNLDPVSKIEEKLMHTATSIRYKSGSLMYQARVYTTQLQQIKLFMTKANNMFRCRILDLFTINIEGVLYVYASILLIDTGAYLREVPFANIYDIPQRIGFYNELEPEAKPARIYLGESIPLNFKDNDIWRYARERIHNNPTDEFTVKIMDFKNDIYHVDIIDQKKNSLVSHLRNKFKRKFIEFEKATSTYNLDDQYPFFEVCSNRDRESLLHHPTNQQPYRRKFNSILSYYKEKYRTINDNDKSASYYQKRFFQVKIIYWCDPNSFAIIPNDDEYIFDHAQFMKEVQEFQDKKDRESTIGCKTFSLGQKCLFLNDSDPNLGKWLRGVIIEMPSQFDIELNLNQLKLYDDDQSSFSNSNSLSGKIQNINNLMYRIRSIDYGFETLRASIDMRPISKEHISKNKGPWCLRCRLFGVYPLVHEQDKDGLHQFSDSCNDMIDCWLRERILDEGKSTCFYALFKNGIQRIPEEWDVKDATMDMVLFHRYDHPYRIEDCLLTTRRKPRYDCLNSSLIDRGLASDCNPKSSERSFIDLDEYIVNLLVNQERL